MGYEMETTCRWDGHGYKVLRVKKIQTSGLFTIDIKAWALQ